MKSNLQKATFGAGCFWGVEEAFRLIPGVVKTSVGFMGGTTRDPSYDQVCVGNTGHAEVIYLEYDSEKVSYKKLLDIFWSIHDSTQVNRQGPDVGDQYRSAIFYYTPEQKKEAEEYKNELDESGKYENKIATEIVPASDFYKAEEYHQKYLQKSGRKVCKI